MKDTLAHYSPFFLLCSLFLFKSRKKEEEEVKIIGTVEWEGGICCTTPDAGVALFGLALLGLNGTWV